MGIWETILIALGLAMDCFAVSIGIGTSSAQKMLRSVLRLAFHFGLFQGGMAFLGWLAGSQIVDLISGVDHWVAFTLLLWVGGRMIKESFSDEKKADSLDPTRGGSLVLLSIATSIDALAVGLSLAMIKGSVVNTTLIIAFSSLLLTIAGYFLGSRLGERFGRRMELLGGMLLIGIGIRVVVSHLF
jgi:putative Mn2+ efflux pump MntP